MENLEQITKAEKERLDVEIANLEFEILCDECKTFLPKDFYEKSDRLAQLKKIRGEA